MLEANPDKGNGSKSGSNWSEVQNEYMRQHYPLARQAAQKIAQQLPDKNVDQDFLTRMLLSQTAHESRWGESGLSKKYNNFGGLKATANSQNKVNMGTFEGSGDTRVNTKANFLTFKDPSEFYDYYASYLVRKMPKAMQTGDVLSYAKALRQQGYYTDSVKNYANGLKSGYKSVDKLISDLALNQPPRENIDWTQLASLNNIAPFKNMATDATAVQGFPKYPQPLEVYANNVVAGYPTESMKPTAASMFDLDALIKLFRKK